MPIVPPRAHTQSPAGFFAEGFSRIAQTRMADLPICRTDIAVEALEFQRFGSHWLGVVVTPWSLLVVLACGDEASWVSAPAGTIRTVTLPAGDFSFLGMNDDILGEYQACSLMSPLEGVADQETARAIAVSAFRMMLSDMPEPPQERGTPLKRVVPIRAAEAPAEAMKDEETTVGRRDFFTRYWRKQ